METVGYLLTFVLAAAVIVGATFIYIFPDEMKENLRQWLRNLLGIVDEELLYVVYNEEPHVGSFMQHIARSSQEADSYIESRYKGMREMEIRERQEFGNEDWFEHYSGPQPLLLSISTYNLRTHEIKAYSRASQ